MGYFVLCSVELVQAHLSSFDQQRLVDAVQLGVIVVVNLAIGMLTPPLGICLFVACSISGARIEDTVRSVIPFLVVLLVDLMIITFWSPMTAWLPSLFLG